MAESVPRPWREGFVVSRLRVRRPGHATLVAYLALFFALGGTAYAAATIGSPEVKDNSLQSIDLKDGSAVKGVDVIDNSLTGVDINEATLTGVAHRVFLQGTATTADPAPIATIGVAAPYTIKATCDGRSNRVQAILTVRGPAGMARGDFTSFVNDDAANVQFGALSRNVTPAEDTPFLFVTSATQFVRASTSIWFVSGQTVAELRVHVIADNTEGSRGCLVVGTLTVAV
jgi:hypothetical protein